MKRAAHVIRTLKNPRLTRFSLHAPKFVEVKFDNGSSYNPSAEYLRLYSPAVDKIRYIGGEKVACQVSGNSILCKDKWTSRHALFYPSSFQLAKSTGQNMGSSFFVRSLASESTDSNKRKGSETRKEISTVEDPFDAPTYNIPEKPVTFTEGASYSIVILAGLGIAAAAAYGVFKELIFEPKEYKIFNKALDRIQNDGQVRVRIGSPITGYGSESRNRAARQRIPNKTWTDEDGVEHIMVNFHIRGPHGAGKVYAEMFKDKMDKQWKFMYLIVEVTSPSPAQLMLESYVPA